MFPSGSHRCYVQQPIEINGCMWAYASTCINLNMRMDAYPWTLTVCVQGCTSVHMQMFLQVPRYSHWFLRWAFRSTCCSQTGKICLNFTLSQAPMWMRPNLTAAIVLPDGQWGKTCVRDTNSSKKLIGVLAFPHAYKNFCLLLLSEWV